MEKYVFLQKLRNMVEFTANHHWILGGDFNLISSLVEKKGGIRILDLDNEVFISFIHDQILMILKPIMVFILGITRREISNTFPVGWIVF
jgi:hypothetical protein